jgi:DNA-binding NarL/FixJ family response regulator
MARGEDLQSAIRAVEGLLSTVHAQIADAESLPEAEQRLLLRLAQRLLETCGSMIWEGNVVFPAQSPPDVRLTRQEVKVLRLLYHGKRPRAIAERLTLAVDTVNMHIRHACEKLGVSGGLFAAIEAHRRGLLPESQQNTPEMV